MFVNNLVYKCLEYLIFVIKKKKWKNGLRFFFFFCWDTTWGRIITRKVEKVYWTASFMAFETRLVLTILHTLLERERGIIGTALGFLSHSLEAPTVQMNYWQQGLTFCPQWPWNTRGQVCRVSYQSWRSASATQPVIQLHSKWNGHVQHRYSGLSKHRTPHDSLVTFL